MLSPTPLRKVLFACSPYPPWNTRSCTVESTLSSPCSRSDSPLSSRRGSRSSRLSPISQSDDLDRWVGFFFVKSGFGVLAYCSLCGTKATLSFLASSVCLSFSTKACAILQLLRWSWQHQPVCHFSALLFLSIFRSVLTTLSSPPSFLLAQSICLADLEGTVSFTIRPQWVP